MAYLSEAGLTKAIADELIVKLIAIVFMDINGVVPPPTIEQIKSVIAQNLDSATFEGGASFTMLINQVGAYWEGDRTASANVDDAIGSNPSLKAQLVEIAHAISPLVVQTIRWLAVFQDKSESLLTHIQEMIVTKLTDDETVKNYNIVELSLPVFDNADILSEVSVIVDSIIPNHSRTYSPTDYKLLSQRDDPYVKLSEDGEMKLAELLLDNGYTDSRLRSALTSDPANGILFPTELQDIKSRADLLYDLWSKARALQALVQSYSDDDELKTNGVLANINKLVRRLAMAIDCSRVTLERNHGRILIADNDYNNIYVYPWGKAKLANEYDEDADQLILNFIRAKNIEGTSTPKLGWTINEVVSSKNRCLNVLERNTKRVVEQQEVDTKAVIRSVCETELALFSNDWKLRIVKDLVNNSSSTLQDILSAYIDKVGDFYLRAMYDASFELDNLANGDATQRQLVILRFLITVIKNKVL